MEAINCPFCKRNAGFDPSTGEVICSFCGVLEPPDYGVKKRPFATCTVWEPVPAFRRQGAKHPWHAGYLQMHLMGIERSMFRNDRFSTRFNTAVGIEFMYKRMGLISRFSMN